MAACRSYAGEDGRAPLFVFYETLPNGSHPVAAPSLDPASGLCFYPQLSCAQESCCLADRWVHDTEFASTSYVNYSSMAVYILFTIWLQRWVRTVRLGSEAGDTVPVPRPPSGVPEHVNLLGVYLGVIASTVVGIAMAQSTQLALPVPERNSMLAATAFLTPMKDIFQFLEDTTMVKITHAMGVGDFSAVRSIFLLGVFGGLACGVVGASLMTLLAYWPTAIEVLLAPGSAQAQLENPGCDLLPSATEVVATARGLWLLISWSWPFQFIAMVLTGLLMGAREFALYGMANILCQLTLAGAWFFGPKPMNLPLLGWASFASNVVLMAVMAGTIALNRPLRQKYGLMLQSPELASGSTQLLGNGGAPKEAVVDGVLAMILDLLLQASGTACVYIAAYVSLQDMYQLSAASAALPQYTAYSVALAYVVKLVGPVLVGRQAYVQFAFLMKVMVALSVILGAISAIFILPNLTELAGYYSQQACEFANTRECLGIYAGLFSSGLGKYDSTIFDTFRAFGFTVFATCIFSVAKAGLYACQDFRFMAKASTLVFLVIFLPVLLVARFFFVSATALYVASVLPSWILTLVFLWRLQRNCQKMMQRSSLPGRHEVSMGQI